MGLDQLILQMDMKLDRSIALLANTMDQQMIELQDNQFTPQSKTIVYQEGSNYRMVTWKMCDLLSRRQQLIKPSPDFKVLRIYVM